MQRLQDRLTTSMNYIAKKLLFTLITALTVQKRRQRHIMQCGI